MGFVGRLILGTVMAVAGFYVVKASASIVDLTGESWWAERNLGSFGGTDTVVKLVGIVIIFVGFVLMTGLDQQLLGSIVGLILPQTRK